MNLDNQEGNEINEVPNRGNLGPVLLDKKQLKLKIQSRHDFIMIFGFQCILISAILSPTKTLHYLAVHLSNLEWGKETLKTRAGKNQYHPTKNQISESQRILECIKTRC